MIKSIDRHHMLYRTTYIKKKQQFFSGQAAFYGNFYLENQKCFSISWHWPHRSLYANIQC